LIRSLLLVLILAGCAASPVEKENTYRGEPLTKLGNNGLLVGHAVVPVDSFPHDRKTTIIYLENTKTKKNYQYGDTQGPFFMKLPPGDYVIKELWSGGGCSTSTGLMISTFFSTLPDSVSYLRNHLEKPATIALGFKIQQGKMTDIGNLLLTCFEWDARDKFKKQFTDFIQDGKFQIYRPLVTDQYECGCKILRKRDGKAVIEMNRALKAL
jgi:hypothetical protein